MTRAVAPTATEMGCRNCHGGEGRVDGVAGFSDETSAAVLAVHDKHSRTALLKMAEAGKPRLCASCHMDPATGTEGEPDLLNLPAAVHGWHANYLQGRGAEACAFCHPSHPDGATMCLRGGHSVNLDCTNCHGTLEDHALSLLVAEKEKGKPGAERLIKHLKPRAVDTMDEVVGRMPWLQEPDCLACHEDFERPDPATASAVYQWVEGPAICTGSARTNPKCWPARLVTDRPMPPTPPTATSTARIATTSSPSSTRATGGPSAPAATARSATGWTWRIRSTTRTWKIPDLIVQGKARPLDLDGRGALLWRQVVRKGRRPGARGSCALPEPGCASTRAWVTSWPSSVPDTRRR